ncbi:MAG: C39 family peptidase [Brevefilum sp.]|nr:C39 family peptidase [Brevefilum sp.]
MPKKKLNKILMIFLIGFGAIALMLAIYFLPPVHDRLSWRIANLRASIFYYFNPPDEVAFSPAQQAEMEAIVRQTETAMATTPTSTLEPSVTPTNFISPTPTQTPSPTATPTPLPDSVRLEGVVHEYQKFNNCGPANLSMALSYWGWEGDQRDTAAWLKPMQEDRNVMPYEMEDYVRTQTSFGVVVRSGGDLEIVKRFVAAGFPVILEKGFEEEVEQKAWMGHYGLITAYDEDKGTFLIQDSYVGENYSNPYEKVERHWRAFNYLYMVIYPPEREQEVFDILGPHLDETYNYQHAAQKAVDETYQLSGRELFFAWFNYGTSLMNLGDYYGSAKAYDQAYEIYADLLPKPWRITWYQTGPYFAYYYTGRYQDVIDLADITISYVSNQPAIEESWVWRGRAKVALGDIEGGIEDFREALKWHPDWWVAEAELQSLGVTP